MSESEEADTQLKDLFDRVNQQLDELANRRQEFEQVGQRINQLSRRLQQLERRMAGQGRQPVQRPLSPWDRLAGTRAGQGSPFGQGAILPRRPPQSPNSPPQPPTRGVGQDGALRVDVADAGDAFVVTADVPGFTREEIALQLTERALEIRATRDGDDGEMRYLHRERRPAATRSVPLPAPIDDNVEAITATIELGVLTVRIPKGAGTEPEQQIEIE